MVQAIFHPELLPFIVNWEAWSTFVVGCAAVSGAVRIGKNQAAILATQADTEALRLRSELYDRRIAVHAVAEQFYQQSFLNLGNPPKEILDELYEARSRSRFIYDSDVHNFLNEMLDAARKLRKATADVKPGDVAAVEASSAALETALDYFGTMEDRLQTVFLPYLKLTG